MSVINRMLRDLDQREQRTRNQTYTPAAIAPQPIHWAWIVLAVLLSAAIIIGALNLWWSFERESRSDVVIADRLPITQQHPDAQSKSQPEPKPEPKPESKPEPKPEPMQQQRQNVAIATISEPSLVSEPEAFEPLPEVKAESPPTAATEPQPKVQPKPADDKPSSFELTRVQLSPEQLAANNLEKAREALRKGDRETGQQLLEKALVVKPDHVEVRSELAAYWYGRGMTTRALTLLQQGLDLRPQQSEWQLLFARILDRMGRVEQAYTALMNINVDTEEAPELLKLRAAAATQLGYFNEAAADYTVLATQFGEGRWWLAAAVAHEDADNLAAAVRCYQQALLSRDLADDARTYIEQRLAVLEGY